MFRLHPNLNLCTTSAALRISMVLTECVCICICMWVYLYLHLSLPCISRVLCDRVRISMVLTEYLYTIWRYLYDIFMVFVWYWQGICISRVLCDRVRISMVLTEWTPSLAPVSCHRILSQPSNTLYPCFLSASTSSLSVSSSPSSSTLCFFFHRLLMSAIQSMLTASWAFSFRSTSTQLLVSLWLWQY